MASGLLRKFSVYGIAFGPLLNIDDAESNSGIHIFLNGETTFWTFFFCMYNIIIKTSIIIKFIKKIDLVLKLKTINTLYIIYYIY